MTYFKFLLGKILNWILNLTAPKNLLNISIKDSKDEIFIENHLGYSVFLNEKNKIDSLNFRLNFFNIKFIKNM